MVSPAKPTIYSVGYSGLPIADFVRLIERTTAQVVDVRLKPVSRNPAYTKAALEQRFGARYHWLPNLGNVNYQGGSIHLANQARGLAQLRTLLEDGPVVVLCVCCDATTCHRTTITTILAGEGYPVEVIRPATLPPSDARIGCHSPNLLKGQTMNAAIYARKSTEQNGVADDQKSVARQVERARAYAASKGWMIDDAHVYTDDGISGAEFASRPGFLRVMNAVKPRTPFQTLIISELSRLGREQLETGYALKQLSQAGVRVWSYFEDKEILLDTPTDKFLMSAVSFAAELERDKARQRTYDAMARKAQQRHVTGGRVFGYDNVPVMLPDGRRSHVERRINNTRPR